MKPSNQNTNTPKTKPYFVEVQRTFSQFLMIETVSKQDAIQLALKDDGYGSGAVEHIPQVVDVREISKDEFMQHITDTLNRLVKVGKLPPPVRGL
jgi:hypothetical protein